MPPYFRDDDICDRCQRFVKERLMHDQHAAKSLGYSPAGDSYAGPCNDPKLGRWIQQDPAAYVNGQSLYQYMGDDPASRLDPRGLDWLEEDRVADWFHNPTPPTDVKYGTQPFRTIYVAHAGWSLSVREQNAPKAGVTTDGSGNWKLKSREGDRCVWAINQHINWYMHKLTPDYSTGLGPSGNDTADFNDLAEKHEARIRQTIQDVFSPNFTVTGDDWQAKLEQEYSRRVNEFERRKRWIEPVDLIGLYRQLKTVAHDEGDIETAKSMQGYVDYWQKRLDELIIEYVHPLPTD
jgi:hypothetical protein